MRTIVDLSQPSPEAAQLAPRWARNATTDPVPRYEMPDDGMDADLAYQLIHDDLLLDGSARLNLARLVTTWMEPQAEKRMAEGLIDAIRTADAHLSKTSSTEGAESVQALAH
jgi:glutamate/tyrosine decarboxylase-like PLP-dependent enzyme